MTESKGFSEVTAMNRSGMVIYRLYTGLTDWGRYPQV
jgi:hypothetical protein